MSDACYFSGDLGEITYSQLLSNALINRRPSQKIIASNEVHIDMKQILWSNNHQSPYFLSINSQLLTIENIWVFLAPRPGSSCYKSIWKLYICVVRWMNNLIRQCETLLPVCCWRHECSLCWFEHHPHILYTAIKASVSYERHAICILGLKSISESTDKL